QSGLAALVARQRVTCRRAAFRAQIREYVGSAKAVDRLLRVADQEQRNAREQLAEDLVLNRVGVLELIDEHGAKLRSDRALEQRAAYRVAYGGVHAVQEIVVAGGSGAPLLTLERISDVAEERCAQRVLELGGCVCDGVTRFAESETLQSL